MHPEIARTLVAQRRDEITRHCDELTRRREAGHPTGRRWFPRWQVSWTRTVLAPAGGPGPAGGSRAGRAGRRGSSLVIIISAHRSA